ncbi:MAG TPA: integrase core domain-containing protein, partial [Terrimicrobiaceae bacterium]|nr:integrase core domain-containing protein [Terrimicrobiaceae bacterium]
SLSSSRLWNHRYGDYRRISGTEPRLRHLNEHLFRGLPMARRIIEAWWVDYNGRRPHTSLGGLTPNEFAARSRQDHNQTGFWL